MSTLFHGEEEAFNDDLKTLATCVQAVALRRPANRGSLLVLRSKVWGHDSGQIPAQAAAYRGLIRGASFLGNAWSWLSLSLVRRAPAVGHARSAVGGCVAMRPARARLRFWVCRLGFVRADLSARRSTSESSPSLSAERMSGSSPGLKPRPLPLQNDPARRYDPGGSCPHGASADTARPGGNPETRETVSRTGGGSRFPTRDTRSRVTIRLRSWMNLHVGG